MNTLLELYKTCGAVRTLFYVLLNKSETYQNKISHTELLL